MSYSTIAEVIKRDQELTGRGRYLRGRLHDSLVVDTEKNKFYWNSRGLSGGINDWLALHGRHAEIDPADYRKVEQQRITAEARELQAQARVLERIKALASRADFYHSHVDKARDYWHTQGLSDETIARYKLGFASKCPTQRNTASYVIPYSQKGELVNIRHRLVKEIGGKYRPEFKGLPNQIFNLDRLSRADGLTASYEVIIVEGEVKAMVLDQEGFRVLGLPGAGAWPKLINQLRQELKDYRVYIAFDPAAEQAAAALAAALGPKASVVKMPGKPDDLLVKNGWTPAQLYQHITRPKQSEARAAALAEAEAERQQKEARLRPVYAPEVIPFVICDQADYIEKVVKVRANFTSAADWRAHVAEFIPEIDSDHEYRVKLEENREARQSFCGTAMHGTDATGRAVVNHAMCGVCEKCKRIDKANLRRFIEDNYLTEQKDIILLETGQRGRDLWARRGRLAAMPYKTYPLPEGRYNVLLDAALIEKWPELSDIGQFLDRVDLTDNRLNAWVTGRPGVRAAGHLIPSKTDLRALYRERGRFEVRDPWQRDEQGRIVKDSLGQPLMLDDILTLTIPGVFSNTDHAPPLLPVEPVHDLVSLQAALEEIAAKQMDRMVKRGDVIYGVYKKTIYIHAKRLDELIAAFNEQQEALRAKQKPPG